MKIKFLGTNSRAKVAHPHPSIDSLPPQKKTHPVWVPPGLNSSRDMIGSNLKFERAFVFVLENILSTSAVTNYNKTKFHILSSPLTILRHGTNERVIWTGLFANLKRMGEGKMAPILIWLFQVK